MLEKLCLIRDRGERADAAALRARGDGDAAVAGHVCGPTGGRREPAGNKTHTGEETQMRGCVRACACAGVPGRGRAENTER